MFKAIKDRVRVKILFGQGIRFADKGQFEEGLKRFELAVEYDPDDALSYSNAGYCHFKLGNYEAAIDCYNRAIRLDPEDAQSRSDLAFVYLKMGRIEKALEVYGDAVRIDPCPSDAYLGMGAAYVQLGRQDDAIRAYKEGLERGAQPDHSDLALGWAYLETERYESAIRVLNEYLKTAPNDAPAHLVLARAYNAAGDNAKSREICERVLEFDIDEPEIFFSLGKMLVEVDDGELAIEALKRVIDMKPDHDLAQRELQQTRAMVVQRQREELAAASPYENPLSVEKKTAATPAPTGQESSGESDKREEPKRRAKARAGISSLLQRAPSDDPEILIEQGERLFEKGRHADALAAWDRAAELSPGDPRAHNNRAAALSELGRLDDAAEACRRALDISPNYAVAYMTLGEVYVRMGDLDGARQTYEVLKELDAYLAGVLQHMLDEAQ